MFATVPLLRRACVRVLTGYVTGLPTLGSDACRKQRNFIVTVNIGHCRQLFHNDVIELQTIIKKQKDYTVGDISYSLN